MNVISSALAMQRCAIKWKRAGVKIAFVPTMGYLHEGHMSLARASRAECDVTIATIFVNPTQFGPKEDFAKYPRTLEADRQLCEQAGARVIFAPTVETMYPENSCRVW